MAISANLAEALHFMNDLLPHREESQHHAVRDAINAEVANPEETEKAEESEEGKTDD